MLLPVIWDATLCALIETFNDYEVLEDDKVDIEENCKSISEEDCLMRRTLVAHTDYIYTQKEKP